MSDVILDSASEPAIPIHALTETEAASFLDAASPLAQGGARLAEFKGKAGQAVTVLSAQGAADQVLFGLGTSPDAMDFRTLPAKLAAGTYRIAQAPDSIDRAEAALAFALGSYRFDRYKKREGERARLVAEGFDAAEVRHLAHACALARDMVNTPANDMGPLQVETIARDIAEQYGARITVVTGEGLLEANYPAVHAVGRAAVAERAPRMIEIAWG